MLLEEARESLAVHLDYFQVGERAHARVARFARHQRHLARDISACNFGKVADLAVGSMTEYLGFSAAHDEHRLALLAGAHQHLTRAKLTHRDGRHQQSELIVAKAAQ